MKKAPLIFVFLLLLITSACDKRAGYVYYMYNNTNYDIFAGYGLFYATYLYPDTSFEQLHNYELITSYSFNAHYVGEPLDETIKQRMPRDTVSIFYFHADTVNKYPWEIIQRDYKILQRYDLSSQDICTLKDHRGIPEIPYPPDERMKDMKMYPPYNELQIMP